MNRMFDPNNRLMSILTRAADLVFVNILWLVTSLPLVTIGASTTALHYVCFRILNGEESHLAKSFFRSFKENFKQATIIWLVFMLGLAVLAFDFYFMHQGTAMDTVLGKVLWGIFVFAAVVLLSMLIYVFALQARFENKVNDTLKYSAIFSLSYYGRTLAMLVCDGAIMLVALIVFPIILPAVPVFVNAMLMRKIFAQYIPAEEEQQEQHS